MLVYADGRYSIEVVEQTGSQLDHNRWYLVEEDGYLKVDALEFGLPARPSTRGCRANPRHRRSLRFELAGDGPKGVNKTR